MQRMAVSADADDNSRLNPLRDGLANVAPVEFGPLANFGLRRFAVTRIVSQYLFGATVVGAMIL
jgi:hypothetical protein